MGKEWAGLGRASGFGRPPPRPPLPPPSLGCAPPLLSGDYFAFLSSPALGPDSCAARSACLRRWRMGFGVPAEDPGRKPLVGPPTIPSELNF